MQPDKNYWCLYMLVQDSIRPTISISRAYPRFDPEILFTVCVGLLDMLLAPSCIWVWEDGGLWCIGIQSEQTRLASNVPWIGSGWPHWRLLNIKLIFSKYISSEHEDAWMVDKKVAAVNFVGRKYEMPQVVILKFNYLSYQN